MAEVHQHGPGIEAEDDAFNGGYISVPDAEISEQGDERSGKRGFHEITRKQRK